ncbi:hypothetical protein [Amycolatopsis sp. CA-128772]|uniref:hypothetical protein n=1 Tax=Amycolatopsis sp. CA-128772 TaxID=2073159 RepID=UPI000CD0C5F8|nr:hypothetical protein [Amycolatopsis sp. CA-128772]
MNDEVSVAELLVREGWGDRPGPGQSRWRVVAVMLAVIVGCGAAAALVAYGGNERQDAAPVDQIQVIPFPQRTTGLGGADQATDSPPDGGIGGGTGGDVVPASGEHRGTVTEVPGRPSPTETSGAGAGTATPTTTQTGGAGSTTTPTATTTGHPPPSGGHSPAPTTTPRSEPSCVLLIICW